MSINTVIITLPELYDGEAERITDILSASPYLMHIRKPGADAEETERLIRQIPQSLHCRLVMHDHFGLAVKYAMYGVHLNSRNPVPPKGWRGSVSRSCHTIEELVEWKNRCDYLSLSPIFNSISKPGYHAAFTEETIAMAAKNGVIDNKVYALGGVTFDRLEEVRRMGFGGAMILGDAWRQ